MPLYTDEMDMETGAAHKGDAGLHVEFYEKKVTDPAQPEIGRFEPVDRLEVFCKIIIPGDKNSIWDQPVRQEDKQRFPRHWLAFNMNRDDKQAQVYGTPLKQWNIDDPASLNENQLVELQAMRFQTVEQVAQANDMQIQRMGLGAEGLKVRARDYLDRKNMSHDRKELHGTKKALEQLQAQMAELLQAKASGGMIDVQPLEAPETDAAARYAAIQAANKERMAKARAARGKKKVTGGQQHASPTGAASHG